MQGDQPKVNAWLDNVASATSEFTQEHTGRGEPHRGSPVSDDKSSETTSEPVRQHRTRRQLTPLSSSIDSRSLDCVSTQAVAGRSWHSSASELDDDTSLRHLLHSQRRRSHAKPTAFNSSSRRYSIPASRRQPLNEAYSPAWSNVLSPTLSPPFLSHDVDELSPAAYRDQPSFPSTAEQGFRSASRFRLPSASRSRPRSDSFSPEGRGPPSLPRSRRQHDARSPRRGVYRSPSRPRPVRHVAFDSSSRRRASSRLELRGNSVPSSSSRRVTSPDVVLRQGRAYPSSRTPRSDFDSDGSRLRLRPESSTRRAGLRPTQPVHSDSSELFDESSTSTLRHAVWTTLPWSSQSTISRDSLDVNISGGNESGGSDLPGAAIQTDLQATVDYLLSPRWDPEAVDLTRETQEEAVRIAVGVPLPESVISSSDLLEIAAGIALPESSHERLPFESVPGQPTSTSNPTKDISPDNADGAVVGPKSLAVPKRKEAKKRKTKRQSPRVPPFDKYWEKVGSMSSCLPHLRILRPNEGRYKLTGTLTSIEITASGPSRCVLYDMKRAPSRLALSQVVHDQREIQTGVVHKVIMVEDLCSDLIDALGSTFELDPEFFAEHLNRAAYDTFDHDDPQTSTWPSRDMPKSYASITWFRPSKQNPKVVEWLKESERILGRPAKKVNPLSAASRLDPFVKSYDFEPSALRMEARSLNGIPWKDPVGLKNFRELRILHKAVVSTNIFRKSWSLSTRSTDHIDEDYHSGEYNDEIKEMRNKLVSTFWTEKASISFYNKGSVLIYILLLDPSPGFTDLRQSITSERFRTELDAKDITMGLPFVPRVMPELPLNKYAASRSERSALASSLDKMISTKDSIISQAGPPLRLHPLLGLLQIVYEDTRAARLTLERALEEISQDSLDDYLMTRKASIWRQLINDMHIELPTNTWSLYWFATTIDFQRTDPHIWTIYEQVRVETDYMLAKLKDSYAALRIDMQFTESRRSITEAKSVAKLTELAFLFIPLSFTASLFSMSIQGLDTPAPVWTFIITALGFAIVAYSARFLIASDILADSTRRALEQFWTRRNVRKGDSAPFHTLLYLTVHELWSDHAERIKLVLGVLPTLPILLLVIIFMWTSTQMGTGFNLALTVAIVYLQIIAMLTNMPATAVRSTLFFNSRLAAVFRRRRNRAAGSSTTSSLEL